MPVTALRESKLAALGSKYPAFAVTKSTGKGLCFKQQPRLTVQPPTLMSSVTATPPGNNAQERVRAKRGFSRNTILIIILILLVLLGIVLVTSSLWPFSQSQVLQDLREASDSQVQARAFHRTYFPFPGCVAEGLTFNHDPAAPTPLITVEKLTIRGSYIGILTKSVSRITVDGLHVTILPFGTNKTLNTTPS
ncbi:MAG TPA: hypothetical protein VFE08_04320, partial [Candidatus Sulfotelmatobacter sp.]|nr:hypothetical protein [Candidatus Sulfotelmatobacter sp.]